MTNCSVELTLRILSCFVGFSEYMNFTCGLRNCFFFICPFRFFSLNFGLNYDAIIFYNCCIPNTYAWTTACAVVPDYLSGQKNKIDGLVFGRSFGWKIWLRFLLTFSKQIACLYLEQLSSHMLAGRSAYKRNLQKGCEILEHKVAVKNFFPLKFLPCLYSLLTAPDEGYL